MNTKAAVLLASFAAALATIFICVPHNPAAVFLVLFTDGFNATLWIVGATALGAFLLKKIKVEASLLLFLATSGGLGLGIFSLLSLGLGLLGYLNHATALAMPFIGSLLFGFYGVKKNVGRPLDLSRAKCWLTSPAQNTWLVLIPVISLTIAAVAASVMPGVLWKPLDPHPYDVVSYHLQVPREWYEAGKILPLQHNVFSYFPMNVEMQYLSLMHAFNGPWHAMYICQYTSLAYAILLVIAIASEAGLIAAAILSCVPWLIMLASVAYVESALMLYTALALIWALRGGTKEIVIAAIMTGLACGVKITAVPMLALPLLPAILIMRKRPSPSPGTPGEGRGEGVFVPQNASARATLQHLTLFLLVTLLVLSPWLIRNFFWATNPIFPIAMNLLGRAHFSIEQVQRFRQAHSPTPSQEPLTARLSILWTDVLAHWQFGYILIPLAAVAAATRLKDRRTWAILSTVAVIFTVWIGFTHLLPRFLVQLIPLAALLIPPLSPTKWRPAQLVAIPLVLLAALLGWFTVYAPLARTTADPDRSKILIGLVDPSLLLADQLATIKDPTKQIALIGDAGAFLYQIPMTRLHYKTVFDLPADTTDPIEAWAGEEAKNNPNWILIINPTEITRLHSTYLDVPPLPPDWAQKGDQPFILNSGEEPK